MVIYFLSALSLRSSITSCALSTAESTLPLSLPLSSSRSPSCLRSSSPVTAPAACLARPLILSVFSPMVIASWCGDGWVRARRPNWRLIGLWPRSPPPVVATPAHEGEEHQGDDEHEQQRADRDAPHQREHDENDEHKQDQVHDEDPFGRSPHGHPRQLLSHLVQTPPKLRAPTRKGMGGRRIGCIRRPPWWPGQGQIGHASGCTDRSARESMTHCERARNS